MKSYFALIRARQHCIAKLYGHTRFSHSVLYLYISSADSTVSSCDDKSVQLRRNTVEPLLSGHPRGIGNWPLNRGWPLNKGSSGIKFWLRENVNLFKYKHALSFLTIVTCNTAITLSSKNHTNPVKNILDKVSTRTI